MDWIKEFVPTKDIVPIVGAVALWIWHHRDLIRKGKIRDAADAAITEIVHAIVNSPPAREEASKMFEDAAWRALHGMGVSGEPDWAQSIVDLAVREGLAELAQEVSRREVAEIAAGAANVAKSFDPPKNPTVPPLGGGMIEITEEKP